MRFMGRHLNTCKSFVSKYLSRPWAIEDGVPKASVDSAATNLGILIPGALRDFYISVGAVEDLCSVHNHILRPEALGMEEGYLVFADENQSVVSWGISKADLRRSDPQIWQRNNNSEEWYAEEKSLLQFLTSMFDWYAELGVWKHQSDLLRQGRPVCSPKTRERP